MPKRLIILAVAVICMTVAMGFVAMQPDSFSGAEPQKPPAETGVTVGNALPEFTLPALDGRQVTVAPAGQILVLNFWATWCPPCRQEMPELDKFAEQYSGKVEFHAVNIQEPGDKVAAFMAQNKYTMSVLSDTEGEVAKLFRINAIPTTLVVDKQGIIKYRKSGPVTLAELEGVLNGL
ncbi:TlpA family protein disulfide reductase [Sporomusa sphaeroides]|uniref:Sporulation thiol-disulfide oxidoreductase A n=1 Tax=Sporomusa sphaeroides DSM 2875 TaxID=1337886 RepID=A0ABM9VYB5_9FIRM|nr:TlpA disulfide reductase family protein [Sporomusa sphaeroides]OLS57961.1 sporulation thiol-disulfide oxidoreductase A precursor [Sporomusa sphaeroides DSM 2875]CVK17852.1 Sporulation thiol-disulfide oxidoreductase A precursor [Sporomusa sphaeroides DSM 2875]